MAGNKRRRAAANREAAQAATVEVKPQAGPQECFLSTSADIAIYGGAAGGGKTFAELLEPLRHVENPEFGAVIFRRTSPQITNEGGLWDESSKLYPLLGAVAKDSKREWHFPSGVVVSCCHLQHEKNVHDWQGSQICLICFDELTHFTERQFFYMLSRNRSTCGVRPYIRATTNPDADSWVAEFIAWWLNAETGYPIPERSGVMRWFVRVNEVIEWADTRDELIAKFSQIKNLEPKSVTFIASNVYDNKILLSKDPGYLANLMSLPLVERERLLGGNWKIKVTAGKVFNRDWFEIVNGVPEGGVEVRFWDFAATEKNFKTSLKKPDPDYTAGVKIRYVEGVWYVVDVIAFQGNPAQVERTFFDTTEADAKAAEAAGTRYVVRWEEEPASASKRESHRLIRMLAGYDAKGVRSKKDKIARAKELAIQSEHGFVKVLKGAFTNAFLTHMHGVPDLPHDDILDGASGAFNALLKERGARVGHGSSIYDE